MQKDFSLSSTRANPKNWDSIVKELKKCILLCSNCHKEIHEGITNIPNTYQKFDEALLSLGQNKHLLKQTKTTYCPVCNNIKENHLITCSKQCAAKHTGKVDWDQIDLIKLIEIDKRSKIDIAKELGCSDAAVGKRYRKLITRSTD